ncbi:MAG: chemotaxis response regulator protein-glutamate methylesterase [Verrucomicrobia bacterium]|nr:chemotaxis response regulator protein-glutamate methylesterase [Verrucomicrobiota bacterium]
MSPSKRIRVLVVDDSAIARRVITESLAPYPEIEVVGTAVDPYDARSQILNLNPDVITLDVEMPRMDGITFLKLIMQHRPMPVIIMSSLTTQGSEKAMEALECGAVDIVDKPADSCSAHKDGPRLLARIQAPAQAPAITRPAPSASSGGKRRFPARSLILIGASTGGPEALKKVLSGLEPDLPGIVIVQHIPAQFSRAMAVRLNSVSRLEVREAVHGDLVKPGTALVAPGGFHTVLHWDGCDYTVELNEGPPVHHQRPAVDVLFSSAVKAGAGQKSLGLVVTGMGSDGAAGLLELRKAGALTVAQDEESSVVYGMPKEAVRLGAAAHVAGISQMADKINAAFEEMLSSNTSWHPKAA